MTDGEENSSREYSSTRIKEMISHQTDVYQWTFLFLAANQDAVLAASNIGIGGGNSINFSANAQSVTTAYTKMSEGVSYRSAITKSAMNLCKTDADALYSTCFSTVNNGSTSV